MGDVSAPRVLHFGSTDSKWVNPAIQQLARAGLVDYDVCVYDNYRVSSFSSTGGRSLTVRELDSTEFIRQIMINDYAAVVLHSFPGPKNETSPLARFILSLPTSIRVAWIGWGFDYYNELIFRDLSDNAGLLPRTAQFLAKDSAYRRMRRIKRAASDPRRVFSRLFHRSPSFAVGTSMDVLNRVDVFSPRLKIEYEDILQNFPSFQPTFAQFMIASQDLVQPLREVDANPPSQEHGRSIVIGNSAVSTVNHLDAIDYLRTSLGVAEQLVLPLAYGNSRYGNELEKEIRRDWTSQVMCKRDFVPPQEYVTWISQFGAFAHAGLRQHAGWNIRVMLAAQRRVILHEDNPLYRAIRDAELPVNNFRCMDYAHDLAFQPFGTSERSDLQQVMARFLDEGLRLQCNRSFVNTLLGA